ncbi:MAG: acyltransferase family protein, partial [Acidimicrobiia bacterium]
MRTTSRPPAHRSDIDGLRAVAIIPVLLFHAHLPGWEGGFLGVDIFFVISGYLITRQLAHSPLTGAALLRAFYERRARGLLPILFVVILATWTLSTLLSAFTPTGSRTLARSTVASLLFLQNFNLWRTSGYWQTSADLSPLTHVWSLAVEEQFYVLFPFLFITRRFRRRQFAVVCAVAAAALTSFAAGSMRLGIDPAGAFYLLPYRAWEILAGSLVYFATSGDLIAQLEAPILGRLTKVVRLISIGGIASSFAVADASSLHPGQMTGVVVLSTATLIALPRTGDQVSRLLNHRLMHGIGVRSYGVYLWHFPMLAIARQISNGLIGPWTAAAIVVASFALADVTWRTIETSHRDRRRVSSRHLTIRLAVGLTIITLTMAASLRLLTSDASGEIAALETQAHIPEVRDDYVEVDFDDAVSGASIGVHER